MDRVIFVVFGDADTKIYEEELPKYFPIGSLTPVKSARPSGSASLTTSATPIRSEALTMPINPTRLKSLTIA